MKEISQVRFNKSLQNAYLKCINSKPRDEYATLDEKLKAICKAAYKYVDFDEQYSLFHIAKMVLNSDVNRSRSRFKVYIWDCDQIYNCLLEIDEAHQKRMRKKVSL